MNGQESRLSPQRDTSGRTEWAPRVDVRGACRLGRSAPSRGDRESGQMHCDFWGTAVEASGRCHQRWPLFSLPLQCPG